MKRNVAFTPAVRRGNGTGHLFRSLRNARALTRSGDSYDVVVVVETSADTIDTDSIIGMFPDVTVVSVIPQDTGVVILDRRSTDRSFLESVPDDAIIVALDDSGAAGDVAEFTINMLDPRHGRANTDVAPTLPSRRRHAPVGEIDRILVTFGGEDPACLTRTSIDALIRCGVPRSSISVVRGPSFSSLDVPEGTNILAPSPDLRESFADYDAVITSYGLTALEATAVGCRVGVVDPSRYHASLSRAARLTRLGTRRVSNARLRAFLKPSRGESAKSALRSKMKPTGSGASVVARAENHRHVDLATAIAERRFEAVNRCPVCGSSQNRAIARYSHATFFRCPCTGVVYRVGMERESVRYDAGYFAEEYRAQYGKTYLEDFDAIRRVAAGRLDRIERAAFATVFDPTALHSPRDAFRKTKRLLDVGCAFGPFLVEARSRGYDVFGIDVSADAIEHCTKILRIPGACVDLRAFDPAVVGAERFDMVTLWYVIEHFPDLGEILERIRSLLVVGGTLALSTPNLTGISGKKHLHRFLERSPRDHYTVLSPRTISRILTRYGFTVRDVQVTGHHPERFPLLGSLRFMHAALRAISNMCRLGDTFEINAEYTGDK